MKKEYDYIDFEEDNVEGKAKKGDLFKLIISIIILLILIMILIILGFVVYSTLENGWGIHGMIKTVVGASDRTVEELGEFQVLVLGVSEDIKTELTDTIMIASYNPETQRAILLSIPRDTFIGQNKSKVSGYDKINAIYQSKGAIGTMAFVNKITGLNIRKYIVVNNKALVELVDEIGGVEFYVPDNMNYDSSGQKLHIHLKKGLQVLDGKQAEGLLRFRKNNNGTTYSGEHQKDDFGRMQTQRDFLKAMAEQTLQAKNITKIGSVIDIINKNVKTNINDWDEIKDYIPYLVDFNTQNLFMSTIPGETARIPEDYGLWFFLADEEQTKQEVKELFKIQNMSSELEQDY